MEGESRAKKLLEEPQHSDAYVLERNILELSERSPPYTRPSVSRRNDEVTVCHSCLSIVEGMPDDASLFDRVVVDDGYKLRCTNDRCQIDRPGKTAGAGGSEGAEGRRSDRGLVGLPSLVAGKFDGSSKRAHIYVLVSPLSNAATFDTWWIQEPAFIKGETFECSCQFGEGSQGEGEYYAIVTITTDKQFSVGEQVTGLPGRRRLHQNESRQTAELTLTKMNQRA